MRTRSASIEFKNFTVLVGFIPKRFAIGFSIDKWAFDLDLAFFWFSIVRN